MANHRPKSLSELNNVYDKAMRAERAIKESSNLLSVPEDAETPRTENIFDQLENQAIQAEKNKVFDPDITNIANDFLKRYAQPEKPKATPKEIKRPAPSIQSVYHTAVKPKKDVALNEDSASALGDIKASSVPLHKPAPTIPAAQPAPVVAEPEVEAPLPVQETPAMESNQADEVATISTQADSKKTETPVIKASARPEITTAQHNPKYTPPRNVPSRVRITSTERNELMEEYLRVMSDDDEEDSYKKPLFSFFKKKKKYEEDYDEESASDLYEELPADEDSAEEITPVPFDNSDVKYTDEYSDAPVEDESEIAQDDMGINDYIEADFDYDEEDDSDSEEDGLLDMSFSTEANESEEEIAPTEEITEDTEEVAEESEEETDVLPEEETETAESEEISDEAYVTEESAEEAEDAEAVVYPQEETEPEQEESPTEGMVFEDIFSVSDESKRSHTGGNWEEVFGESFNAVSEENAQQEAPEEIPAEYPEYTEDSSEEYAEPSEETDDYSEDENYTAQEEYKSDEEPDFKEKKGNILLKILTVIVSVICILGAAATLVISAVLDVNSGNLISDRYRAYSVSEAITELGLSEDSLVITENIYAHTDDLYVYLSSTDSSYGFGKVTSSITNLSGDYLYVTENGIGTELINRDNSMGVIVATYDGIGGILATICQYYILIAGAFILLAVAMIVCLILISKKKAYEEDMTEFYDGDEDFQDDDTDGDDSYTDEDADDYDDEESDYYTDYDTDGIEQGLFSNI